MQVKYDQILGDLRAATPHLSEPSSPETDEQRSPDVDRRKGAGRVSFEPLPPAAHDEPSPSVRYWNEYDYGSDRGGDDEYAIYVNPDEESGFPGIAYVKGMMSGPYGVAKQWFMAKSPRGENQPLLGSEQSSMGYASTAVNTDSEEEGYASSDGIPQYGYSTHFAFPSVGEQRVARYREKVLLWSTAGCFAASYALLAIAGTLIATGKHKLRVEVDAGVTVGVMLSLFAAGSGLVMTLYRQDRLPVAYWVLVWAGFVASCILNGMLLVLVLGNTP